MQDFQVAANPPDEAIAAEKLGLTHAERNIIVVPKPTMADQQMIWNAPAQWDNPPIAGSVLDYMKRVDHFLEKTGINFKELGVLLALKFIDKDGNLFIKHLDLSCDTAKKEIANLNETSLDRIHRFLRLQKKIGWKLEVMDAIITQPKLGNGLLDDVCLINAATLLEIAENTGINIEELIGFYGEIPHVIFNDDAPTPLYQQVFLNKAKNGFVDEGLLPEKVDGSQLLTNFISSISVALQLKHKDLEEKLLTLLADDKLSFANLSYLFAASRLMKKLKLKTDDFVALTQLRAINISQSPQKTLDFIDTIEDFKKSPLRAVDVKFMLWHDASNIDEREMKEDNIKLILEKLQKEYQHSFSINKSRFDKNLSAAEQKESLQNELAKLSVLIEEDIKLLNAKDIKSFIKFIDKGWILATDAKTFVDEKLSDFFDTTAIKGAIDELESVAATKDQDILDHEAALLDLKNAKIARSVAITPAEIVAADTALTSANAQLFITLPKYNIATGKNLIIAFFESITSFQLLLSKQNILELIIASSFKIDLELVKVVLEYAELKQPGMGLIATILLSDSLIDTDAEHPVPVLPAITDIAFGNQYAALKLLHKLLPLINAFKLSNSEAEWYLQNNQTLAWLEWDSIPYTTGQTAIDYDKYIAFAGFVDLSKQLTPVPNPADAEHPISFLSVASMLLPVNAAIRDQFIGAFSLLTGYEKNDVDDIDAHLFPVFDLNNYTDVKTWRRIMDCAESLRKLGVDISQIIQSVKPVLLPNDVNLLRSALKSRYDEDTWLETLKEIMDAIRPKKRNALVAWLLATNPSMKDENDLFDFFLVDVEMESCMPTSRIVQAHGTIQLFAQRCLMGLEPRAAADVDNDTNWNQWKWMKNYRVWEANRKVFLYPENWIEADLRDEKSFLFTELENELQQNELTEFTAEDSLIKYLEKLDTIAFLEVMATWYQTDIKTMHVFARTKGGDPAIYYYRRFEQERYWTPWEKVELDITGDHLLAFVRNNRLCLAWPLFTEEPDPGQGATMPDLSDSAEQPIDKPRRKLKIQLAISEFANKKWQPKKVSKDGILTPSYYSNHENDFQKDLYHLTYFPIPNLLDVICVFSQINNKEENPQKLNGVFSIAGCKGYPELLFKGEKDVWMPDFLPDFNDTALLFHRYTEQHQIAGEDLSVKNGISKIYSNNFIELLKITPGNFRISFPHQFTIIDALSLIFQLIFQILNNNQDNTYSYKSSRSRKSPFKIPMGTLLPYFKEDSKHAYVIIPGFYKRERAEDDRREPFILTDVEKRTASDVLKLLRDTGNLFNKYKVKYQENPPADLNVIIQELLADNEFQEILNELSVYEGFDAFYNFLIGKTGNADIDKILSQLKEKEGLAYGEQFKNMYHPLICALRVALYKHGIPELMKRETQLLKTKFDFKEHYSPNPLIVPHSFITNEDGTKTLSYPIEDIDFNSDGSYSVYNWELFFHVPLLIASRLTKNQRFEEALTWFHYMFNPTGALSGSTPQKYWVTKPFYLNQDPDYISQRIDTLLYKIADHTTPERKELELAIEQWRNKPFKPHVVARFRPVAYQKALLMKYIDNLTEWGDHLFRQDTMESIAQATQMYILADKILGPKPRIIPPVVKPPYESYNQIENKLDAFGNALIGLENILPDLTVLPEEGKELPPPPLTLSMLYFCIPHNEKMMEYWDRIADRLFKIRHCQNIEGTERSLALFAPPIDPGVLVRAAASGLDISSVLAGMNAPTPYYRFNVISQKATELAQEIRGLGNALLQTLEKKDAEAMSLLRSEMETKVLNAIKDMKLLQIKEAKEQIEVLKRDKKITEEKHQYYATIEKISSYEKLNLNKLFESYNFQLMSQIVQTSAGIMALIPDLIGGASGFGGSPHVTLKYGGENFLGATKAASEVLNILSSAASYEASLASILGGYDRRFDDWKLQERLAKKELASIEKRMLAAEIRKEIAETDLKNHELQIDNAKKTDEFMHSKFTNKELYDWMIGQISSVYFKSYQLAHDYAKKAERCYRFELGNDDSFISYGYWDSMKKGLQSADNLIHDIKRMETSYLDKNKREYELTKHISLVMLDPLALTRLCATGTCDFDIPEVLYDMDYAGHYFRRIKSVSISLPCIAGPYTSVSARFSLVNNRYRKNTNPDNAATTGYIEDPGNDERFIYNVGSLQSIAASNSQNDSGVFELNFRDERYVPFEGTGAISSWRLELPLEVRQFDYNTISDVIIHMKYTAREGGSGLKNLANTVLKERLFAIKQQLSQEGLHVAINMNHDLFSEWHLFKKNATVDLKIDKSRLPYMAQTLAAEIEEVMFVAKVKNNPATFSIFAGAVAINLSRIDEWKLCRGMNLDIELDTTFTLSVEEAQITNLEELMLI
ncbi:MAG: hypothetical protein H7329_17965, partial [Opitutaceae bacterium]|nr:hypothetical protein [Cytophagales bacterium]